MNKDIMSTSTNNSAYLELIIGPMYSGKSSRLVEIYKQCKFCNISVAVINHSIDNRYDEELLSTHDKVKIPCIKANRLSDVWSYDIDLQNDINKIPNGQEKFKDGDFERKKFGSILDLIPLCDKVTKLTSLCSKCKDGTPGIFSMRLTNEVEQTVVGSDNYIPVCRKCYKF